MKKNLVYEKSSLTLNNFDSKKQGPVSSLNSESKKSGFLIHVSMQQLLRQLPMYIEKNHYHVDKKVGNVRFAWHTDT